MAAKQKGIMVDAVIVAPSLPNFVKINVLGVESQISVKQLNSEGIEAVIATWSDAFRAHCKHMRELPTCDSRKGEG